MFTTKHSSRRVLHAGAAVLIAGALLTGCATTDDTQDQARQIVHVPEDTDSINDAVDLVADGGMILIDPGTYRESVLIDKPDVTIRGVDRNSVIIDGEGERNYGIVGTASGVRVQNLTVVNNLSYGVLITGMHDGGKPLARGAEGYTHLDPDEFPPLERFEVSHVTSSNNGLFAIYAFDSHNGEIHDNYASGAADSGVYVGQCKGCMVNVYANTAERNAVGFENANASDSVVVAGNNFSNNRVGMLVMSNYQEAFIPQRGNTIVGNLVADNNALDTPQQATGSFGIGIALTGGQDNVFERNTITGNSGLGVWIANAEDIPATGNQFLDNTLSSNALDFGDSSQERAPATGTQIVGDGTRFPAGLGTGDAAGATGTAGTAEAASQTAPWPALESPKGISFLKVQRGDDQPSMPGDVTAVPEPLTSITSLNTDSISAPTAQK